MSEAAAPSSAGLVLASASPFRRKLLEAAGVPFRVVPAKVDEAAIKRAHGSRLAPAAMAETLAAAKAEAVSRACGDSLVIGSDQVAALGDRTFDKPADVAEARAHLKQLRGKTHRLFARRRAGPEWAGGVAGYPDRELDHARL